MSGGLGSSVSLLGDVSTSSPILSGEIDVATRYEDVLIVTKRYNSELDQGIGVAPSLTPYWMAGRIVSEAINMQPTLASKATYGLSVAERGFIASALTPGFVAMASDAIHVQPALSSVLGVIVLQGLGIAASPLPTAKYTQSMIEGLGISPVLRAFFGASVGDGIGVHESLAPQFRGNPAISDSINLHAALSQALIMKVVVADTFNIDDEQLLKMIFNGEIDDGVNITTTYVSPDGQFSTWAMNTRTGAISEYTNYAFNSFARMDDVYYGASASGLYQLLGDTDAGTNIIAELRSGYAQWGQSKFSMFKGVYLGVRGEGNWVLKLITGDGNTYNYAVSTRNQRTTKVHMGKGLKARYWAFDLISSGQDFDLDTIEFVPIVSERRV